jgi:transcriptional regulator with XRE-family HTH domain
MIENQVIKSSKADIGKRFAIILKENELTYRDMAELLTKGSPFKLSHVTLYNAASGKQPLSAKVLSRICFVMGYSPNWILTGRGEKKARKEDNKIITDIQQFRVELSVRDAEIDILKSHVELLFKMVEDLKK